MTKSKKISIIIASFLLVLAGLLFASCGSKNYSQVSISSSEQEGSITLFEGESATVSFTVENPVSGMDTSLVYSLSNPSICDVEVIANQNNTTSYQISAVKGGTATLEVKTIEGNKSAALDIYVKAYSNSLTAAEHSLYVSQSSSLIPSSYDFTFSSNATEKDLTYYFFGQTADITSLTIEDVQDDGNYINQFNSINLILINNNYYLILEDEYGNLYTLGSSSQVPSTIPNMQNTKYSLLAVTFENGEYQFDIAAASTVQAGEKFAFIALYDSNSETPIYCAREFYVLLDIDSESIAHSYGYRIIEREYQIGSDNLYILDENQSGQITLIPDYQMTIEDNPLLMGNTVSFITVYLQVTINTTSPLILSRASSSNLDLLSSIKLGEIVDENAGTTTYYYELNCANGSANELTFDVQFYYEGFENSEDDNVNFNYSIPVSIRLIPTSVLVNNEDLSVIDRTFTFYNSYAGDSYGWQEFNFNAVPTDAEYSYLTIDLTNTNLRLRYRNTIYTSSDGQIRIDDLRYPVYLRGEDGAPISQEIQTLPISLYFNVLREDSISIDLQYQITQGAQVLDFNTDEFEQRIYIDLNDDEEIAFTDIYADASFSSFTITLDSGNDVARFIIDESQPYILQDGKYFLNIKIRPIATGNGTYAVALDNGRSISLSVTCDESLENVQIISNNTTNVIRNTIQETENDTKFYAYRSGDNVYFDVAVVANDNENSSAIKTLNFSVPSSIISLGDATNNNKNFNIYLQRNGSGSVNLTVTGYEIEDFGRTSKTINYVIDVVVFDYIENLRVYKEQDGKDTYRDPNSASSIISQYGVNAAYADVYTNTNSQDARTAIFHAVPANEDAYLFALPSSLQNASITYEEAFFSQNYVYWQSSLQNYYNNQISQYMYYDPTRTNNVYTVGEAGTFDTSTMTFIAAENTEIRSLTLTCHVRQYGWLYSYTINISITAYEEVENVTLQSTPTSGLEFSSLRQEHTVIAYVTNSNATNKNLVAIVSGGQITVDGETVSLLTSDSITSFESDNRFSFTFKANPRFIELAEGYTERIEGEIIIASEDWVDSDNNLLSEYQDRVVRLQVTYANGTMENRFTLETAEDVKNISQNLSAHYKINTTIDISSITSSLPLGNFSGSIIGTSEYAKLTGINISSGEEMEDGIYYGLFTNLTSSAFIEYVSFEGTLNVNTQNDQTNYIGLLAGQNSGTLLNIGISLNESNVTLNSNSFVGVVAGLNEGNIVQDYTLFETDSNTKTASNATYIIVNNMTGRYDYSSFTPNILVFSNSTMAVNVNTAEEVYIGGVSGYQSGIIQKIDSNSLQTAGYTNYTAYSLINVQRQTTAQSQIYVGGLAGYMDGSTAQIIAGFNENRLEGEVSSVVFIQYSDYQGATSSGNYTAGKGIIVGGQISGYDNVAGVIGSANGITNANLSGITSRVFVRGQMYSVNSQTYIANTSAIANATLSTNANFSSAFAIQAIDEGRLGSDASLIIIYDTNNDYSSYTPTKVAFGSSVNATVMQTEGSYINVLTYLISREKVQKEADEILYITSSTRTNYYGDFVVLATERNQELVRYQIFFFTDENSEFMSVEEKFNNAFLGGSSQVFYMYYFDAADGEQSQGAQTLLDTYLNRVSVTSSLYPFNVNGEMTFSSQNSDILTIDQSGRITVKRTGLAAINGTSLLNNTNSITIYIFVTNYFNPNVTEGEDDVSIIYPNGSSSSRPIDETTIDLRGNNTASLYILPNYSLTYTVDPNNSAMTLESTSDGVASLSNIVFSLSGNSDVTAEVTDIQRDAEEGEAEEGEATEGNEKVDASAELDVEISGQIINFRRNENTRTAVYSLKISPMLKLTINGEEYTSGVNKEITDTVIDYKKGAQSINNVKYAQAPIISSNEINETIIVSSDAYENELYYYIVGLNGEYLQGSEILETLSGFNLTYTSSSGDYLFVIDGLEENLYKDEINGFTDQSFSMRIGINKNSTLFKNRFENNIYGRYQIFIISSSNTEQITSFYIIFDQTNITSVVVDNYSNINEAGDGAIASTSDFAYPGSTGLLAITITPEDADFDYILIENAEENYQTGRAVANFAFAARKSGNSDDDLEDGLFDDSIIRGSTTNRGIRLTLDEIMSAYSGEGYVAYNGVIYVTYEMGSANVIDDSISYIVISLVKDGQVIKEATKELTIKLQNFVNVEIDGKEPTTADSQDYHASYAVARGVRYKLNINSYGFMPENITLTSGNENLGTIVQENGEYYLQITNNSINYTSGGEGYIFDLLISASQQEGENTRSASSRTRIQIQEYVINYNGETALGTEDIISGMGNGVINIQVGSQTTLEVDIYDYIEYNPENSEVVGRIENFMSALATNGKWKVYTNLINDLQPDYGPADDPEDNIADTHRNYNLGYVNGQAESGSNYFFNYNGLNITPVRTHLPEDGFYVVYFKASFTVQNGLYVATALNEENLSQMFRTLFMFNVYTSSSNESPIPIYDYDDFMTMQSGGYYILLNDITLPSKANEDTGVAAFQPQAATFKSFDGNGHSIIFSGTYDMGSLSNIGIFTSLPEDSIIKNLNVVFTAAEDGSDLNLDDNNDIYELYGLRTVKFITTATTFNFGGIVGENNGIITNCKVSTDYVNSSEYYIAVIADNSTSGSLIGGIAGTNTGYITNSVVSANFKTPFRIGGVVGNNSGKIAASVYKEGKIINNSNQNQYAAGFAYANLEGGQIITSYVAGTPSNEVLYTQDRDSYISSNEQGAGFVYQNLGTISDCYTDIYLGVTPHMAGFVYENGGEIKNSFSVSVLSNENAAAAGFAYENVVLTAGESTLSYTGTFENCYYFYNIAGSGLLPENYDININTSLQERDFDGVSRLNAQQFNDVANYFGDYSYQNTIGVNAIWFVSDGNTSTTYVEYVPSTSKIEIEGEDGNVQTNTIYNTQLKTFSNGRLELVSANVDALSIRNFSYSQVDEATGNITYYYVDDSNAPNNGTIHNPRIIYDSDTMESEILNQNANNNINITNYRIVSDISYSEKASSSLYKTIFAGILEGNGMEITQISLLSEENLTSAGLFAQVGYSASRTGSIKNLTISPTEVTFSNANCVGTVAGILRYGYLYDININSNSSGTGSSVVYGMNFVGGIVGRANTSYIIKNVTSDINVTASYSSSSENRYTENSNVYTNYSYAGAIVGFAGAGNITNAHVSGTTSVMGSRAGFAYGGIGQNASVNYTFVDVVVGSSQAQIKAYHFGGLVAGEVSGNLNYSYVYGNSSTLSIFSTVPTAATAVGGIAGSLAGGNIKDAVIDQPFRVTNTGDATEGIYYVGGLVGAIIQNGSYISTISNAIVYQEIEAGSVLGGAVGYVNAPLEIDNVAVKAASLSVTGQKTNPYLGGIIGQIDSITSPAVTMQNSYCLADLNINTITYGVASTAYVGGLIGSSSNNLTMRYCYTTSKINASVSDSRALGNLQEFNTFDNDRVQYSYNVTTNQTIENVYYFGHGSIYSNASSKVPSDNPTEEEKKAAAAYKNDFVTYNSKARNATMHLVVNNYGESSVDYAANFAEDSSTSTILAGTAQSTFYNLFGGRYETMSKETIFYNNVSNQFIYNKEKNIILEYNSSKGVYEKFVNITSSDLTEDAPKTLKNPEASTLNLITYYVLSDGSTVYYNGGKYYTTLQLILNKNGGLAFDYNVEKTTEINWEGATKYQVLNVDFSAINNVETYYNNSADNYYYKVNDYYYDSLTFNLSGTGGFTLASGNGSVTNLGEGYTLIPSIDHSQMTQIIILQDSNGNLYERRIDNQDNQDNQDKQDKQGIYYYSYDNGQSYYQSRDGSYSIEVPTIPVWMTNIGGFSTLYFESQLSWLDKA